MDIVRMAHSCFRIKTKKAVVICDPCDKRVGYKVPKMTADIVTVSHEHDDHNMREQIKNEDAFVVDGPGEYEIKGIRLEGLASYHDDNRGKERGENTIFLIETPDGVVGHLGDLGHMPGDKILEKLKLVDVLLVPVGGYYTIDAGTAAKLVEKIQPTVVVPMHYQEAGLAAAFDRLSPVDEFVKKCQLARVERQAELSFKVGSEETDESTLMILAAKAK